ncbi:MAG: gamma-glutamyltransferase [Halobacteriovoraceae bacterium]|nr:gamma-glutamyltransferase [Halobacteriovoraceae bacterium]
MMFKAPKLFILLSSFWVLSCSGPQFKYRTVPMAPGESFEDHVFEGQDYVVTAQGDYSTKAGVKMYELGGNAIDAAAAVSFCISVERPQSTGIGGGGFLVFKSPEMEKPVTFDFREKAPLLADSKMYLDKEGKEIKGKSLNGIFAGGVPGLVAGIVEIHKEYGSLPLATVMQPAIDLAEKGFKVYPELAFALRVREETLRKFPASVKIFFDKNKHILKEGDLLVQSDLAKTLKSIAKKGRDGFYKGWVADAIVAEERRRGGLIRYNDLSRYNMIKRKPVEGKYKDYEIYSMGPPSSGGIHVIQILNILEPLNLGHYGIQDAKTIHYTASAMQQAFADRARYLGDMDFVKVPLRELTSKEYAKKIREKIPHHRALKKDEVLPGQFDGYESTETTHFSIMDKLGNMVSSTQTINGFMGSGLVIPGTGILLNNEMDDFATKVGAKNLFGAVGGENNLVESEKRPLSSMSPTLVLKKGKPVMAVGTPSGTRILTCVAQTILNYIEHNEPLLNAVSAVRFHQQWYPDELRVGTLGLKKEEEDELRDMGYKINHKNLGCRIQAIAMEKGQFIGVSDPRGLGLAAGK